jgi:hypothetical protein
MSYTTASFPYYVITRLILNLNLAIRLQKLQYVPKWHILNAPGAVNLCVIVACHSMSQ